ncbi:Protein SABRE [Linum perenne]
MAASPVKFLFGFLLVCITLWLFFIFASRLVTWILGRILGASIGLRVSGWKSLRDIVVKFKKGPVESVSVGEIRVSLRQSLVKLGVGFISKDPKLQVLICDLEIVLRPSGKVTKKKTSTQSGRSSKTPGRGKWMVLANVAKFLSVSMTDLVVKTAQATVEVKDMRLDISKDGGSNPNLFIKLHILPICVHMGDPRLSCDLPTNSNSRDSTSGESFSSAERALVPFFCDEFFLSVEFGHDRGKGIVIQNVDICSGEVSVNLNEELLLKRKSMSDENVDKEKRSLVDSATTKDSHKKIPAVLGMSKFTFMIPEKISFTLPKLDVRFLHQEHSILIENNIMGLQFKVVKSPSSEDVESTRLDIQMDFSELHLLREAGRSVVEILKVDLITFIYVPKEASYSSALFPILVICFLDGLACKLVRCSYFSLSPTSPIRAEIDVKLGGTQCNIIISRLKPWLRLQNLKKKKTVLREEVSPLSKPELKAIMWTCTVSAPEMTLVLYSVDDLPLYHGCTQSSHVFANNISNMGTSVHMELGELNLHMADEYQECLKESPFIVESNSGALLHVPKVILDWGKKDTEPSEEDGAKCKLGLSVDVTGMGAHLNFKRLESLVVTAISFQALAKSLSPGKKMIQSRGGRPSKSSGKGTQILKFNLERCSVNISSNSDLENTVVADPKRVNYGSQGGRVVITDSDDGTSRTAEVISTVLGDHKKVGYTISLDIINFCLCVNKGKQSTELEIERARATYEEYLAEHKIDAKVTLFDIHKSKYVRRAGGLKGVAVCSLFSAMDITIGWEPDLHISLVELMLRLKAVAHSQKVKVYENEHMEDSLSLKDAAHRKETSMEPEYIDEHKKKESIFAVDVEMLTLSAVVGDGVDAMVQVQSIFSENAQIGVLLEGLLLRFNGTRVVKSSRMQISRVPSASTGSSGAKVSSVLTWDWVVQGLNIHISLPYRLELRAIDDSVEEMLRALKLVTAAKTQLIFPIKKVTSKLKKPSSTKFGCFKFYIRKFIADIEEEPMQGWLDEHYHLMKNRASELAVRLNFLDECIYRSTNCPKSTEGNDSTSEKFFTYNGVKIDIQDASAIQKLRDEIYLQSFRKYYDACQKLVPLEGSGACIGGFQAGFKPSTARASLFSISATDLDLTLTKIDGGEEGMIEVVKKLDPVALENNIPFSRLYGSNIFLRTASLIIQLRDYTFPLLGATSGKCQGCMVLAQQATPFQPQMKQDVFIGRWRKVCMLRSATGTTPPMKSYFDLSLHFQRGEVSYGVSYEPTFADLSYAFTVALRRANLSVRNPGPLVIPPKKERSLPWWDDMRNYIHGRITLSFTETLWHILATTDPYEKLDKAQITSGFMEIQQSDGRVFMSAKDFKFFMSSLDNLAHKCGFRLPPGVSHTFLEAPTFTLEVTMEWECESGSPMNHYLFALPIEEKPREFVFDRFRSTSLALRWNFSLRPPLPCSGQSSSFTGSSNVDETVSNPSGKLDKALYRPPTLIVGAHDLAWLIKFWNLNYLPPNKLRSFSRWPRYGVPRIARSGNLSLDKVMTEFCLRVDATPTCIRNRPMHDDDPTKGLTFSMSKLKYEACYSRGKQKFTFESIRDPLDLVYLGVDLHVPKAVINEDYSTSVEKVILVNKKNCQPSTTERVPSEKHNAMSGGTEQHRDSGFLLSCAYFSIRKQSPKADASKLLAWQEAGRRNAELTSVRSDFDHCSDSDENVRSDHSDDDGYNVIIADNCQRIFVYGLKILWNLRNRDAVWSFAGGLAKAFAPPKPSPSRQYSQRKLLEESQTLTGAEGSLDDTFKTPSTGNNDNCTPVSEAMETSGSASPPSSSIKIENLTYPVIAENASKEEAEEEGTRHFMVNVIEPQFNLHSEEANGRFLLAAVSGRVLARSFHSVLQVGHEIIEHALVTGDVQLPETVPEMTWKRMELSVMLEHVQAHVAPTDVDPGAGLQWLPKIRRSSPKVKRTGALLERVFMPCDMYFRYTRHKGGTPELKVKPLKELTFNTHNITATMTSRQFQVMLDVLTNLLFARLPKPKKNSLSLPTEDEEDMEEEADEVVPDGVEEVELARIDLQKAEQELRLVFSDIRSLSLDRGTSGDSSARMDDDLWMITGERSSLIRGLKREVVNAKKSRKEASSLLRVALQKAAHLRLMEKEKNKSPSYAMRISLQINKVVWSMLIDGKPFAEAEINDMIFDFDRDYKDVGVALFTTKVVVVRNCLPNTKSDMVLSPWNPPPDWGKKVMLRVDAKQGTPKDGNSRIELFMVEIYPLKIHLTETMYRMLWTYFFPEEEQDSQRRQEVWKVSTTAAAKRLKKGMLSSDVPSSSSHGGREPDLPSKLSGNNDNMLRRTSSFDRTWEETVAETVANELLQAHSSNASSSKGEPLAMDGTDDKNKSIDPKAIKSGRPSQEEKKVIKTQDEKRSRPRKVMEFQNIKISQVELQITYESSRFNLHELKLLMDTFHRVEFTGTWRRLFSRVKKHVVWGTLKSVTGMQGKKFKDKGHGQKEPIAPPAVPDSDLNLSDNEGQAGKPDQYPNFLKRPTDGAAAGDGFVTSVRGLFNNQRRKAKAFVLRTMRGEENGFQGDWSDSDAEFSPFARQLTITKAKKLIRRHTKKFRSKKGWCGFRNMVQDNCKTQFHHLREKLRLRLRVIHLVGLHLHLKISQKVSNSKGKHLNISKQSSGKHA